MKTKTNYSLRLNYIGSRRPAYGDHLGEISCESLDEVVRMIKRHSSEIWSADVYRVSVGDSGASVWDPVRMGTLYTCDRNGINAEPINQDDTPCAFEDVESEYGCNMEDDLRKATSADGCAASVDFVAVNADGEITGYFKFVETTVEEVAK